MKARGARVVAVGLLLLGIAAYPAAAQPAGTLVVGLVAEPVNLDPPQVTDINSLRVSRRIVETLVTFPDESTQLVPGLAESWTISRDGLMYTFKLRKGVRLHDGTPLNAEAVEFSIERQINADHPFNKLGKYPFAVYFFGNVKAVEAMGGAPSGRDPAQTTPPRRSTRIPAPAGPLAASPVDAVRS